jgi:hypothetical protein
MLDGHRKETWQHTAAINFYAVNRERQRGDMVPFSNFYPFDKPDGRRTNDENKEVVKRMIMHATGQIKPV